MAAERGTIKKRWWLVRWLERSILPRVWYVHAPVILMIHATPSACLETMTTAARPSTQRLHLRNLFVQGRRYHIRSLAGGFRLTTTSKVQWRYRQRTSSTAVMKGTFEPMGDDITRIHLQVRINVGYLLDTFLIPGFMTTIIVFVPWSPLVIGTVVVALFTLSWIGHRSNAALEANEMVWFVQKALEDFVPAQVPALEANSTGTFYRNRDFEEAWQKFYEERRDQE